MKIYITHSSGFDYKNELYKVLRGSVLNQEHEIYLPHEGEVKNTKEEIRNSEVVVAHISGPSTGQGIELGWATDFGKRVIVVYKTGAVVPGSIQMITKEILEYSDEEDLIVKLNSVL